MKASWGKKELSLVWFNYLEEIRDVYKIETRKHKVDIDWPFQAGIAVYLLAKLWVLQFYYDCLDTFFELIQMDTNSLYFALSYDSLEEVVHPELQDKFQTCKKEWFSWNTLERA